MPLTNAERQKRYRERMKEKPEEFETLRQKHLERVKKNIKKVADLTENEQKRKRQKWREASQRYYQTKKTGSVKETVTPVLGESLKKTEDKDKIIEKLERKNRNLQRELKKFNDTVQFMKTKMNSMKKQIYRLKKKLKNSKDIIIDAENVDIPDNLTTNPTDHTPRKQTEQFLQQIISEKDRDLVRPPLLQLNVLTAALKSQYETCSNKEKVVLKNVVTGEIAKKYKLKNKLHTKIGLKNRIRIHSKSQSTIKKMRSQEIRNFFTRDDVSRASAGKKECLTLNGVKMQKRYLLDNMLELHKIYKAEGGKASYTTFRRNRPFYVVIPKLTERDTCACIKHSNLHFKTMKLKKLNVLKTDRLNELVNEIACDPKSKTCMYNECEKCKHLEVTHLQDNLEQEVSWLAWTLKKIQYMKKTKDGEEQKFTKKYVKEVIVGSLDTLLKAFQQEMKRIKTHVYNVSHQHEAYKMCVENLKENEAAIICDFSENYMCKHHSEIQGMHFGGSRNQISLHTGVLYTSKRKPLPFCTISPSNEHNPASIWAHLDPIINLIKTDFPEVTVLHFFSDGPTTQYRQKHNFYLLVKQTATFEYATWSFFEASHGKGAADGVGGAIKRSLDRSVAYGKDVTNAQEAFDLLKQKSSVALFYVSSDAITRMHENITNNVLPLRGTMSVHQLITHTDSTKIFHRVVSCFCGNIKGKCDCFEIKEHKLYIEEEEEEVASKKRTTKVDHQVAGPSRQSKRPRRNAPSSDDSDSNDISEMITYDESDDSSYKEEKSDDTDDETTLFCLCSKPASGKMIACDNKKCVTEWYHYACVGISRKPRGKWFCVNCKK